MEWSTENGKQISFANSIYTEDTEWEYIDKKGHRHKWVANEHNPTLLGLPTLHQVDDDDNDVQRCYVCKQCNEIVRPSVLPRPNFAQLPFSTVSLYRYYVNGQEVTREFAISAYNKMREKEGIFINQEES